MLQHLKHPYKHLEVSKTPLLAYTPRILKQLYIHRELSSYGTQVGQGPCAYKSGRGESADKPGTFFTEAMTKDKTVLPACDGVFLLASGSIQRGLRVGQFSLCVRCFREI